MIKAKDIERDEPIDLMVIAADVVSEMALKELELIPLFMILFKLQTSYI